MRSSVFSSAPSSPLEADRTAIIPGVWQKAPGKIPYPAFVRSARPICTELPGTSEKLSHGEPSWFAAKRVYAMFSNNHHNDGHVAVWIPLAPGEQQALVTEEPGKYYVPPYAGRAGWRGVEFAAVNDEELRALLHSAWNLITAKATKPRLC